MIFSARIADVPTMGHARGFLATVAVRAARRHLQRRRLRDFFHLSTDFQEIDVADPSSASPEELASLRQLYRTLDRMPPNQRIAWTLRYMEGLRLEDVAEHMGASLASIKRWISAAQLSIGRTDGS